MDLNGMVKKMGYIDIQFVKIATAAFILMIAKLWDGILALDWYWYLIIAVLACIKPVIKIFKKDPLATTPETNPPVA